MAHPKACPRFGIWDGLVWMKIQLKRDMISIFQSVFWGGRRLIKIIIDHAHQIVRHYGHLKTLNYIQSSYWWLGMGPNIESFCTSCTKCKMNKTEIKHPTGLLHSHSIPDSPWQTIRIDFMGPLPKSNDYDYLMVIIDQLMSHTHLILTTSVTAKGIAYS